MFGFIISLSILWPPQLAMQFDTPPVQEYTIKSNFTFRDEGACQAKANEFLAYAHGGLPLAKMMVSINCYVEGVVDL
jgi:hypothetical protein